MPLTKPTRLMLKTVLRFKSTAETKSISWTNIPVAQIILCHMAFEGGGLRCLGNPLVCLQSETHDMAFCHQSPQLHNRLQSWKGFPRNQKFSQSCATQHNLTITDWKFVLLNLKTTKLSIVFFPFLLPKHMIHIDWLTVKKNSSLIQAAWMSRCQFDP